MAGMTQYMLDTNVVSHLIRGNAQIAKRIVNVPMATLYISAVTAAELHYGLAKRPEATRLHAAVGEFLKRVDTLPWDSAVAESYGEVRNRLEQGGRVLGSLDMMIAAHALHTESVLVTNDQAFGAIAELGIEDWTAA